MLLSDKAISRLAYQYQNSESFKAYTRAFAMRYDDIFEAMQALETRLSIDESVGAQLDGIGEIVGFPRPDNVRAVSGQFDPDEAFAFAGGDGQGFGGLESPGAGGRFVGLSPATKTNDDDYRILLRSAIFRNFTSPTIPNMETWSQFVLRTNVTVLNGVGFVDVTFQRRLLSWERLLIDDNFPVSAGIDLRIRSFSPTENPFGFAGNLNSTGFGGVGVEQVGGGFVGLF